MESTYKVLVLVIRDRYKSVDAGLMDGLYGVASYAGPPYLLYLTSCNFAACPLTPRATQRERFLPTGRIVASTGKQAGASRTFPWCKPNSKPARHACSHDESVTYMRNAEVSVHLSLPITRLSFQSFRHEWAECERTKEYQLLARLRGGGVFLEARRIRGLFESILIYVWPPGVRWFVLVWLLGLQMRRPLKG